MPWDGSNARRRGKRALLGAFQPAYALLEGTHLSRFMLALIDVALALAGKTGAAICSATKYTLTREVREQRLSPCSPRGPRRLARTHRREGQNLASAQIAVKTAHRIPILSVHGIVLLSGQEAQPRPAILEITLIVIVQTRMTRITLASPVDMGRHHCSARRFLGPR